MAASFKKINVKTYQKTGEKVTTDTLYWKNLEVPVVKKEYGAISHIDFSPISPYQLAVTNSTRVFMMTDFVHVQHYSKVNVQIYNSTSLQIHKTLSRFKQVAYCGSFRSDGKLLVAGGDEGSVRLFDVASKNILRIFKGHAGSVHVSRFLSSNTHVLTGSDDNTVRIWDIPSSYDHTVRLFDTRLDKCVMCVDHGAPVESVLMFPTGGLFVSAVQIYDGYLILSVILKFLNSRALFWGRFSNHSQLGLYDIFLFLVCTNVSAEYEYICERMDCYDEVMFSEYNICCCISGGSCVRVWDALAGGKLVTTLSHHHKTITCLAFASNHQRLLSGALDRSPWPSLAAISPHFCALVLPPLTGKKVNGTDTTLAASNAYAITNSAARHIKIYDVSSYQVVHTLDCPGAVLSVGVSPDDSLLAVGTVEGLVSLQRRKPDTAATQTQSKKKPISFRYGLRGKTIVPSKVALDVKKISIDTSSTVTVYVFLTLRLLLQDDYVVEHRKKEKLAQYDRFFKNNETIAVDFSKLRATMPQVTVGVMQELARRGALRSAIAGREGGQLKSLLSFIRNILKKILKQSVKTLYLCANCACLPADIYGSQMGRSSVLDTALHQLKVTVDQEVTYMTQMLEVIGQLDTLFSASQATQPANKNEGNGSCDLGELLTMKPSESATAAF
ncbi:UTP15-like protein [Mya arenaria]|uniref:U3 small nucleolar RNA-associated protein 15 homolog n=1 Tax=Mya arenaria TaxID=6604 RepID=A0ABY7DV62_MYAAR|nr:UTP15-like protein [Mya arenaria]